MGKVVLDQVLRSRLNGLNEPVEFQDETGLVVGRFLPESVYQKLIYAWAKAEFATPEAEKARQEALADFAAGRVMTTEQVLKHLKELDGNGAAKP